MGVELGVPEFICSNSDDVLPSGMTRDVGELEEDISAPIPNIVSESFHLFANMLGVAGFLPSTTRPKTWMTTCRVALRPKARRKRSLRFFFFAPIG